MASNEIAAWDVVVVPFPYSERLAEKRRPALVVSNETLHGRGYVWIVMITGAGKEKQAGDVMLRDLEAAGLPGASMIRTAKIATVERSRILRRIGALPANERAAVTGAMSGFIAT